MSVTVRLSRIGKKRAPAFKIVAMTTRAKLNGKAIEVLGHYNPSHTPVLLQLDKERLDYWKKNGAIISPAVVKLSEDKYEFVPYTRQNEMKDNDDNAQQAAANEAAVDQEIEEANAKSEAAAEAIEEKEAAKVEAQEAVAEAAEEAQANATQE